MKFTISCCLVSLGLLWCDAVAKPLNYRNETTPKGFVKAEGGKFTLDGEDFYFAGSNAYYFPFNNVWSPGIQTLVALGG